MGELVMQNGDLKNPNSLKTAVHYLQNLVEFEEIKKDLEFTRINFEKLLDLLKLFESTISNPNW